MERVLCLLLWAALGTLAGCEGDSARQPAGAHRFVLIGDSISTSFYISDSSWEMRSRIGDRIYHQGNWFSDTSPGAPFSLRERLGAAGVEATFQNLSRVGSFIDGANVEWSFYPHTLASSSSMGQQVDAILAMDPKPDWVGVWIGHNNLDVHESDVEDQALIDSVAGAFEKHLEKLIEGLAGEKKVVVTVFGLINFEEFLAARQAWEKEIGRDESENCPRWKKCFELAHAEFVTIKEDPARLISLAQKLSARYQKSVDALSPAENIRLRYSGALSGKFGQSTEVLREEDMWHLTPMGHDWFSTALWMDQRADFRFIGVEI